MGLSGGTSGGGISRSRGMYGPEDDVAAKTNLCARPVQFVHVAAFSQQKLGYVQYSSIEKSRSLASVHVRLQCSAV